MLCCNIVTYPDEIRRREPYFVAGVPGVRPCVEGARAPLRVPDRPAQPQQRDLLAVGLPGAGAERQPDGQPGQEVRADLHLAALLLGEARAHGHPQEHGPRQDVAAVSGIFPG